MTKPTVSIAYSKKVVQGPVSRVEQADVAMSDFAPFVAAALRDKAFDDLLAENRRQEEKLTQAKAVEITGPGGSPVYAKGVIDQGKYGGCGERWYVETTQEAVCPLESLCEVEICLGGIPLLGASAVRNAECNSLYFLQGSFDEETGMGLFEATIANRQTVSTLGLLVGPFESEEEYENLQIEGNEGENVLVNHVVETFRGNPGMVVAFEYVLFDVSKMQRAFQIHDIPEVDMAEQRAARDAAALAWIARAEENGDEELAESLRANFENRRAEEGVDS